jgi:homoserine acetyltransferase
MLWLVGSNSLIRYRDAPTLDAADKAIDDYVANYVRTNDANDVLYALESSRDYDPAPRSNGSPPRWLRSIRPTTSSIPQRSACWSARFSACRTAARSSFQ